MLVPRATTNRLVAAEYYKYGTTSSFIPLNPSHKVESNELSPGSGAAPTGEQSLFLTLLTAIGLPQF